MKRMSVLLLVLGMGIAACDDGGPLGVSPEVGPDQGPPSLDILTWNVYVGARLSDLLLVQDPNQIPIEAAKIFAHVQATDFPARAAAIADEISERTPDVISLQEISLFRTQSPGDFLVGNPVPAEDVALDFLEILLEALAARGVAYDVAVTTRNFDIELPMVDFATGGLDDIRLTDFDVILVRAGRPWENATGGNFQAFLPISLGGAVIPKPSGWASVDVTVHGRPYRIVNSHLEAADIAPGVVDPQLAALQAAQAAELTAILDGSPHPVFLTGDLNSAADGTSTSTYQDFVDGGFVDAWSQGRPGGDGYTSNQDPDLLNVESALFHRIDFILYRDATTPTSGRIPGAVETETVGDDPGDRTPTGLWPSDHAGVFGAFLLSPGGG